MVASRFVQRLHADAASQRKEAMTTPNETKKMPKAYETWLNKSTNRDVAIVSASDVSVSYRFKGTRDVRFIPTPNFLKRYYRMGDEPKTKTTL